MADTVFNYVLNFQGNAEKVSAEIDKLQKSLGETSLEYEKVTIEARKLEQAQRAVADATDKYNQSLKSSEADRAKYAKQIDAATLAYDRQVVASSKVIAGITNMNQNVALSAKGFNSLANSVNQIGREIPNFAQSAEVGFRAISNNIGPLVDAIDDIRKKGGTTKDVFNELASSLFSFNSLITAAITLVTIFGPKLFEVASGAAAAEKAIASLTKDLEFQDAALKQKLDDIDAQTKIRVEEAKQRGASIVEINAISVAGLREQLNLLETEKKRLDDIYFSDAFKAESQDRAAAVQKNRVTVYNAVNRLKNDIAVLEATSLTDRLKAERDYQNSLAKLLADAYDIILKDNETARKTELRHLDEKYKTLFDKTKGNEDALNVLRKAKTVERTDINIKHDKIDEKNALEVQAKLFKIWDEIGNVQNQSFEGLKNATIRNNKITYEAEVRAENERFKLLTKGHEATEAERKQHLDLLSFYNLKQIKNDMQALEDMEANKRALQKKFDDLILQREGTQAEKLIAARKDLYKKEYDVLFEMLRRNVITEEQFHKENLKLITARNEDIIKITQKQTIEAVLKTMEMLQEIGLAGADFANQLKENRLNDLQREFDQRNAILEAQQEKELNNEFLTAKQKDAINKKYAKEKLANDLKLEKEQNKLKKRQFETDKAFQISQAIISIAFGITKAVSTKGYLGIAEGIMIAATGALQLAKIAATKFEPNQTAANASISADIAGGAAGGGNVPDSTTAQGQPNISFIGSSNNQLANTINGNLTHRGTPVFKTYVLASDVTNQAQLDRQLVAKNTI